MIPPVRLRFWISPITQTGRGKAALTRVATWRIRAATLSGSSFWGEQAVPEVVSGADKGDGFVDAGSDVGGDGGAEAPGEQMAWIPSQLISEYGAIHDLLLGLNRAPKALRCSLMGKVLPEIIISSPTCWHVRLIMMGHLWWGSFSACVSVLSTLIQFRSFIPEMVAIDPRGKDYFLRGKEVVVGGA